MVSIDQRRWATRLDALAQSADLNLRDLLEKGDNPVALATYLWCSRHHTASLVNEPYLADWGKAWIQSILIDGGAGRRKDEEIASAALAAVALYGSSEPANWPGEVRGRLSKAMSEELRAGHVPFRRPAYAAMLLLAAASCSLEDPQIEVAAEATVRAFMDAAPAGRFYGIGIAVALSKLACNDVINDALISMLRRYLTNPAVDYENAIYLAHGLCLAVGASGEGSDQGLVGAVLSASPVWSYLMVGTEAVTSAGPPDEVVDISPLVRAVLLDTAFYLRARTSALLDATPGGGTASDRGTVVAAFAAYASAVSLPSIILLWLFLPSVPGMWSYWILHDYRGVSGPNALQLLIEAALILYFAPFAVICLQRLVRKMITQTDASAQSPVGLIVSTAEQVFKPWLTVVGLIIGLGLVVSFLYPPLQHLVGGG
jgi:hypothetical protein